MKLLIVTQSVDLNDPVLGFFHFWIKELAQYFDSIVVICLKEGEHNLPSNVRVVSLGKERGRVSSWVYSWRFILQVVRLRKEYDRVFVHMNQEYILLAGAYWKVFGKKIYLWRNHHAGSFLTDIAASFCARVFCTSKYSYTAKYRKTALMPVGIDTELFSPDVKVQRNMSAVLMLARISPSKRQHLLVEALQNVSMKNVPYTATIVGDPLEAEQSYAAMVKEKAMATKVPVTFLPGVPNMQTPALYRSHNIFVNASSSGMFDKTIFEALACECLSLSSNKNLQGVLDSRLLFEEGNAQELSSKLEVLLKLSAEERALLAKIGRELVVNEHGIQALHKKLSRFILG